MIRFTPNGFFVFAWVSTITGPNKSGVMLPQAITPKPPAFDIALTRLLSESFHPIDFLQFLFYSSYTIEDLYDLDKYLVVKRVTLNAEKRSSTACHVVVLFQISDR